MRCPLHLCLWGRLPCIVGMICTLAALGHSRLPARGHAAVSCLHGCFSLALHVGGVPAPPVNAITYQRVQWWSRASPTSEGIKGQ